MDQLCSLLGGWDVVVAFTITTRYLNATIWVGLGVFGLESFSIEDFRCAEGIPGIIQFWLIFFFFFRACVIFDWGCQVCWRYTRYYWIKYWNVDYTGFDSILLRRLPTDYRALRCVDQWGEPLLCWWWSYFGGTGRVFRVWMTYYLLDIGGCYLCSIFLRADRIIRRSISVLGYYPCVLVLGTGNNNGHYCAETSWPYSISWWPFDGKARVLITRYLVGIRHFWGFSQYSLEIVFGFFNFWYLTGFGCVHIREAVVWFYTSGYGITVSDF